MKTTKANGETLGNLKQAAALIKEGNKAISTGKKDSDNGKAFIAKWLADERKIKLADEPIDEVIIIQDVCTIQIGSQTRFDEKAFALAHPELYEQFRRKSATVKFIV